MIIFTESMPFLLELHLLVKYLTVLIHYLLRQTYISS